MQITTEQVLALAINLSDYIVLLQDSLNQSMQRERALKEALDKAEALKNLTSEDFNRLEFLSNKIVTVGETGTQALELKWIPELHEGSKRSFRLALDSLINSENMRQVIEHAAAAYQGGTPKP